MAVKKRLGEMLLEAGAIDETQLQAALGHQRKWGGKLGQALVDLKLATEPLIVAALSKKFGYAVIDLARLASTPRLEAALKLVPRDVATRHTLLPLTSDTGSITVAMADPSNIAVVDELSFRTGRRVKIALAGDREIASAIRRFYYAEEEASLASEAIPLEELSGEPVEGTEPYEAEAVAVRDDYFPDAPGGPVVQRAPDVGVSPPWPRAAAPAPFQGRGPAMPAASPQGRVGTPALAATVGVPARAVHATAAVPMGKMPERLAPLATPAADLLGEPILATELAPPDEALEPAAAERPLPPRPSALFDALERAARGDHPGLISPDRVAAVLLRILVKRGIVSEREILDELTKT